ncbi:MAG: hypothetical protein EFT35_08180 [Methanophagales archaeon ANME-1-THS]|nr:MAG: hypothetical protein EFT35_08180 [Methanophagales archaeon ANME-1-THS]
MHTIEALLALMLIISVVTFAAYSGSRRAQGESSVDTQLMLYGEDFLCVLDMERSDHTSWLSHQVNGTVNKGWNGAANITREWQNTTLNESGVFCKVEMVNVTSDGALNTVQSSAPHGNPPENSMTVTRLVTLVDPIRVYEVRLTLWYL